MPHSRLEEAIALMQHFAERTGLTSTRPPRRYLWTDAFAVCNDLGLARLTGDGRYLERALHLVAQVHHVLGQHRDDEARAGWISGLDDALGEAHPTRGGLRIGKPLAERGSDDPLNERLEWDRDGQYFHYLTQWMHALDQVARATRQAHYNLWARELAQSAFHAFTYARGTAPRRMVWKMSIDLSRPQVAAMGQHDPLEGYLTTVQLRATAATLHSHDAEPKLDNETTGYAAMLQDRDWATGDPLGIGGLLRDAYRVYQLMHLGAEIDETVLPTLLHAALTGLHSYARSGEMQQPAHYRLAFRELGLAIGLHAVARIPAASQPEHLDALRQYLPLREVIETFWRTPAQQQVATWLEHQDINEVMLATSLIPDGFVELFAAD